jgi:hypothetical protein
VNLSISCHALAKKQALLLAKRQPLALGQANVPVCALAFFDCCTTVWLWQVRDFEPENLSARPNVI